eukprot:scaffold100419_cov32-Tisochrysis_lutea.AAC.1
MHATWSAVYLSTLAASISTPASSKMRATAAPSAFCAARCSAVRPDSSTARTEAPSASRRATHSGRHAQAAASSGVAPNGPAAS